MFSDLYYLSKLIDKSCSLNNAEKIRVFASAKQNEGNILKLTQVFEDEQRGIQYIKEKYKKDTVNIGNFIGFDSKNIMDEQKLKHIKNIRNNLNSIKSIEEKDKLNDNKSLDNLISNI